MLSLLLAASLGDSNESEPADPPATENPPIAERTRAAYVFQTEPPTEAPKGFFAAMGSICLIGFLIALVGLGIGIASAIFLVRPLIVAPAKTDFALEFIQVGSLSSA
jgi:hypothetical protein